MKVLLLRADDGGCAFYRTKEPARVVSEQFPNIEVRVDREASVEAEQDPKTHRITVHEVKEDVDLIVVQRPLKQAFQSLLAQARRQGIATAVELDDDFSTIHQANSAYRAVQPESNRLLNKKWLEITAGEADMLTCTTPALGKYNDQYEVLSNYVPESIFDIRKTNHNPPVVGWTGTVQTHPGDLDVTRGQVGKMLGDYGSPFFVVGDSYGVGQALKLRRETSIAQSDWVPLSDYYQTIADSIDIGIVPLERSDFNNAKSWLKGLEFAALGIPFVASATADYQKLHDLGVGKISHDHNGFRYALRSWLNDPDSARADGESYRSAVQQNFTYEQHAEDWVKAWERAIDIRKKAGK